MRKKTVYNCKEWQKCSDCDNNLCLKVDSRHENKTNGEKAYNLINVNDCSRVPQSILAISMSVSVSVQWHRLCDP